LAPAFWRFGPCKLRRGSCLEAHGPASERRSEANRLNAQASTCPRTEDGKARSSQNAHIHGLTARCGLLAGADPEEFDRLSEALTAGFRPQNTLQHELVERLVCVLWRLRRVPPAEAALLVWLELCLRNESFYNKRSDSAARSRIPRRSPDQGIPEASGSWQKVHAFVEKPAVEVIARLEPWLGS
jgi:hypothetical protein